MSYLLRDFLRFMRLIMRPVVKIIRTAVSAMNAHACWISVCLIIAVLSVTLYCTISRVDANFISEALKLVFLTSALLSAISAWAPSKNILEIGKRFCSRFFATIAFMACLTSLFGNWPHTVTNKIGLQLAQYVGVSLSLVVVGSSMVLLLVYCSAIPAIGIFTLLQKIFGFPLDEVTVASSEFTSGTFSGQFSQGNESTDIGLQFSNTLNPVVSITIMLLAAVGMFFAMEGPSCWKIIHAPMSITAYVEGTSSSHSSSRLNYYYIVQNHRYTGTNDRIDLTIRRKGDPITIMIDKNDPQFCYFGNPYIGMLLALASSGFCTAVSICLVVLSVRRKSLA